MARRNKKLYYEIIPADEKVEDAERDGRAQQSQSVELSAADVETVTPERDGYAELMQAAKNTPRVRFRLRPDYNGSKSIATMFLAAIIIAGGLLLSFAKSRGAIIGVSVCLLAAIAVGISVLIYVTAKAKRVFYCYFENTERGVFCASATDELAVIYAYGRAYRIERDNFYTVDERAFIKYLDGECCGLMSVLCAARGDVEITDDGVFFVKNSAGGGHTVIVDDGRIVEIQSEQPYETDEVDAKTGEARIKTKMFVKTDPVYEFTWELPEFVKDRLADNGIDIKTILPESR